MAKASRRYVAKAEAGNGWRILNKKSNKWWGQIYPHRPDALIDELNGEKRPEVLIELSRKLQFKKQ
ncbi:MAG: hypothetical protein HRU38_24680 [Saccharospirillaceae bacterium]|nr:hypothetical protein [Saccharospirillaceae bacterium]